MRFLQAYPIIHHITHQTKHKQSKVHQKSGTVHPIQQFHRFFTLLFFILIYYEAWQCCHYSNNLNECTSINPWNFIFSSTIRFGSSIGIMNIEHIDNNLWIVAMFNHLTSLWRWYRALIVRVYLLWISLLFSISFGIYAQTKSICSDDPMFRLSTKWQKFLHLFGKMINVRYSLLRYMKIYIHFVFHL